VSEKVAVCCSDPDVAVTVTVDGGGGEIVHDPPPPAQQPAVRAKPHTQSASKSCTRRRFLQPRQHNPIARTTPGNSGRELRWTALEAGVVVETVSVVEAAAPEGVTVVGEKLHEAPVGSPEQTNDTAEANPFCGVTVTVVFPGCPDEMVSDGGARATEKSGGGRLMV